MPRKKSVGRPRKYNGILEILEDDDLYSPAILARIARAQGLLESLGLLDGGVSIGLAMQRIRIAFIRISSLYNFPDEGDGQVRLKGQAPVPCWFGWRWKKTMSGRPAAQKNGVSLEGAYSGNPK